MWLIDFLYGNRKVADVPLWALEWQIQDAYNKMKKEEKKEQYENAIIDEWEQYQKTMDDYVMDTVRRVKSKR